MIVKKAVPEKVVLAVDRDGLTNGLQLCIEVRYTDGSGLGYRLHGPKYLGQSKNLVTRELTEYDLEEIAKFLKIGRRIHKRRKAAAAKS